MARQPSEDITKLPRWAQMLIDRLQRDLESSKKENLEIKEEKTGVMASNGIDQKTWLPKHTHVHFYLDPEDKYSGIEVGFRGVYEKQRELWVSCSHRLLVLPVASNSIELRDENR